MTRPTPPEGHVLLGRGGEFKTFGTPFDGMCASTSGSSWYRIVAAMGNSDVMWYAVPSLHPLHTLNTSLVPLPECDRSATIQTRPS